MLPYSVALSKHKNIWGNSRVFIISTNSWVFKTVPLRNMRKAVGFTCTVTLIWQLVEPFFKEGVLLVKTTSDPTPHRHSRRVSTFSKANLQLT